MEVVSGPIGKERVHFKAPAANRVDAQMTRIPEMVQAPSAEIDPVLKAGLAHLWFVTIHPFDDGNGRIARAIADMALARSENSSQRFYSMSAQIRQERGEYYDMLEKTQKGPLDITPWMEWFLGCLGRAIEGAQITLARFWRRRAFGRRSRAWRSMSASAWCSTACWMDLRANSQRRNTPSSRNVRKTPPCAIFCCWSSTAFWREILKAGGARATHLRRSGKTSPWCNEGSISYRYCVRGLVP